jgi:hypothetical protein
MTVAAQTRTQAPRTHRLEQLEDELDQLVLAARQLEVTQDDLIKALRRKWNEK